MKNKTDKDVSYLPFLLTPEVFRILSLSFNFSFKFSMTSVWEGTHTFMSQGFSVVRLTVTSELHLYVITGFPTVL